MMVDDDKLTRERKGGTIAGTPASTATMLNRIMETAQTVYIDTVRDGRNDLTPEIVEGMKMSDF